VLGLFKDAYTSPEEYHYFLSS